MTLDEMLAFRRAPEGEMLLLFKLEDCPPCDLLEDALPQVSQLASTPRSEFVVDLGDKRTMGAVLKAGVTEFPFIELYSKGARVLQSKGIRGSTSSQVASNLSAMISEHIVG